MAILRIRDENGEVREVLALRGPKGEDGGATTETYNVIVPTAWTASGSYYYQDISVPGMLATDNPIPGVAYGEDNDANVMYDECFVKVLHITVSANSVRVWATEAIDTAFPLQLKVVR